MNPHKSPRVGRHVTALFEVAVGDTMHALHYTLVQVIAAGLQRDRFTIMRGGYHAFQSGNFAVVSAVLAESHFIALMERDSSGVTHVLIDLYTCRNRRDGRAILAALQAKLGEPIFWSDQSVTVDQEIAPKRELRRAQNLSILPQPLVRSTFYGLRDAAILDGTMVLREIEALFQQDGYDLPFTPLLVPFHHGDNPVGYTLLAVGRQKLTADSGVFAAIHTYGEYGSKCIIVCGQGEHSKPTLAAAHNLLLTLLRPTKVQFAEGMFSQMDGRKNPHRIAA